ncbi:MAG: carbohydrate binding family 9 domain-containing protein [Myxococcales bacterium]|nr:carbohydrate binding family 9 domain-containing protein [Myxococcales bacterium]
MEYPRPRRWLTGCALVLVCACFASGAAAQKRLIASPLGEAQLKLDGRLDEPIWSQTQVADDFVERAPLPGAEPAVKTSVRVLYDRDTVYLGLRADLFEGDEPRADTLSRDVTRIWSDESFTVKFDVRHDRRSTVVFVTNPRGAQLDAIAVENGRVFRREFDAVWEVATHIGEGYWSAEMKIPVAALGLPSAEGERVLGFNVARDHNARLADYDWSHLPPEFGPWAATHYGELHGLRDMAGGRPFTLQPYLRWGAPGDPDSGLARLLRAGGDKLRDVPLGVPTDGPLYDGLKIGGDVRLRIGDDTWTELTVLTDFAQVDADDQVINFDRFPLFFPERRPFFLSGLQVFEFGEPGLAQLLFTRRIGLDTERQPLPILTGFKLYGSEGMVSHGFLQVFTDETLRLPEPPAAGGTEAGAEPAEREPEGSAAASWSVGRARLNFASPGHVGLIVGLRNDIDLPFYEEVAKVSSAPHLSLGADLLTRPFGDRFELTGFGAATISEGEEPSRGHAYQGKLRFLGQTWQPNASVLVVSKDFDPQLGFVRRKNAIDSRAAVPLVLREAELGLASVTTTADTRFVHDHGDRALLRREAGAAIELRWQNGYELKLGLRDQLDVVTREFPLFDDLIIGADRYRGGQAKLELSTPSGRNPSGSLTYLADDAFFSGISHGLSPSAAVNLGPHLRLTAGGTLTFIELEQCIDRIDDEGAESRRCGGLDLGEPLAQPVGRERRRTLTVNSSVGVTPDTRLSADLTLQLNTQSERGVVLLRMRYRYLPGSDLFLVYQENLDYADRLRSDRSLIVKATYRYDAMW